DLLLRRLVEGHLTGVIALEQAEDVDAGRHLDDRPDVAIAHAEEVLLELRRADLAAALAAALAAPQLAVTLVILGQLREVLRGPARGEKLLRDTPRVGDRWPLFADLDEDVEPLHLVDRLELVLVR